jgi:hypothetical protein
MADVTRILSDTERGDAQVWIRCTRPCQNHDGSRPPNIDHSGEEITCWLKTVNARTTTKLGQSSQCMRRNRWG